MRKRIDDDEKFLFTAWIATVAVFISMFWMVLVRPASAFNTPFDNPAIRLASGKAESWQAHPSLGLVLSVDSPSRNVHMIRLAFPVAYQGWSDCGGIFERQGLMIINNPSWQYEVRPEPTLMRINDGEWMQFDRAALQAGDPLSEER